MIQESINLQAYTTFGVSAVTRYFTQVINEDQVRRVLSKDVFRNNSNIILGGGSNVLFTRYFDGIVLQNVIKGIEVLHETDKEVIVRVGSGEVWHDFVMFCIENNWGGVENLSLIPGSVGASPMQNIGAYGVEVKEVFQELEAIDLKTGEIKYFDKNACAFGYRESVFKRALKDQYLISRVTFRLSKQPVFNTSYGAIEAELEQMGLEPSLKSISDAVIKIRRSKLPDPKVIGNAGSFFKNPIVAQSVLEQIQQKYPNVVFYPAGINQVKLAAGWLIDQAGWKGRSMGNYGVHKDQALVLVNYGGAEGVDILGLSHEIIHSVKEMFGVELEREVNIY